MSEQADALESKMPAGAPFGNLFVAPRTAFAAFLARPRAVWLAVTLLAACYAVFMTLWLQKADLGAIRQQALEASGIWDRLAPDQKWDLLSQARSERLKWAAIGTLGPVLLVLGATAAYMAVFRLVLARPMPFRAALAVVAPANLAVDAVRLLLILCAMALSNRWSQTPDAALMSNAAYFLDQSQQFDAGPLFVALSSVDVFTAGLLALLAVGFSVAARERVTVTGSVVGGLWVVYVGVKLLVAAATRGGIS